MKTIEEAAYDRYQEGFENKRRKIGDTCYIDWANFGRDEAEQWIPVDEELPDVKTGENGFLYSEYVLLKVKGYDYPFVGLYVKSANLGAFDIMVNTIKKHVSGKDITHWRPITHK